MAGTGWWMYTFLVLICFLHITFIQTYRAIACYGGSRVYTPFKGPDICLPCEWGTFMPNPEKLHSNRDCYPCTQIQNKQLEIFVSPCTRTHDTVIDCIEGYYRTQPSYPDIRSQCKKCTECLSPLHTARACQRDRDTVCCAGDNYGVYINKDGNPKCVRECGRGEYLDSVNNQCLPCPPNTYMDENQHINIHCKECARPQSRKETTVRPCNSTHAAIIGCIEGFARTSSNMKQTGHTECLKLCGKGQYLNPHTENCVTCPENTYMDEDRHSHIDQCKPCEFPKSLNEAILQLCNATQPSVIGCRDGFFQQFSNKSARLCVPCRQCSENTDGNIYTGRSCSQLQDTVCCHQPDTVVLDTISGPVCVFHNRTSEAMCGEGEFLSINQSTGSVTCQPCPEGSHMEETKHTRKSCLSCEEFPHWRFCSSANENLKAETSTGLTLGQIFGVTFGAIFVAVCLSVVVILWVIRYRKRQRTRIRNKTEIHVEESLSLLYVQSSLTERRSSGNGKVSFPESGKGLSYKECRKNPGHKDFIPYRDFTIEYLPDMLYRNNLFLDLVRGLAALTVCFHVRCVSRNRPETFRGRTQPFPLYKQRGTEGRITSGTGWISEVDVHDLGCECWECHDLPSAEKPYATIKFSTAAHVVFDDFEAEKTTCYLFYDDQDMKKARQLVGFKSVDRYGECIDFTYMYCHTKDIELAQQLKEWLISFETVNKKIHETIDSKNDLVIIVSHPHGQGRQVTIGNWIGSEHLWQFEEIKTSAYIRSGAFVYNAATCPGSAGAHVWCLGLSDSSQRWCHSSATEDTAINRGSLTDIGYASVIEQEFCTD